MRISSRVCHHLRSVGYHANDAARFSSLIEKWVTCSGPEWAVDRLKSVKQAYHTSLQTGNYTIPAGWATRRNRKGKTVVKDRFVHSVLSRKQVHPVYLAKTLAFFRSADVIKLASTSKKQEDKMFKAIESPRPPCPSPSLEEEVMLCIDQIIKALATRRPDLVERVKSFGDECKILPDFIQVGSPKSSPVLIDVSFGRKPKVVMSTEKRGSHKCVNPLAEIQVDMDLAPILQRHSSIAGRQLFGCDRMPILMDEGIHVSLPAGRISVIQEVACKARWVANPTLTLQALGEPLKVRLAELCKNIPTISTFDQDLGREEVVRQLGLGRTVWSYDQSAFTDRFPVTYQLRVLESLRRYGFVTDADVDFFKVVIGKSWTYGTSNRTVKWEVGQPLGFGPSFHLATLTHALIVQAIGRLENVPAPTLRFRIVGDDIVIFDERMAKGYERFISNAGMEINDSKSMVSSQVAEFLGRIISSEGVPSSLKVRDMILQDAIVSAMRYYGKRGLPGLTARQKRLAAKCYLPEYLGGNGWRLEGTSYKDWLASLNMEVLVEKTLASDIAVFTGDHYDAHAIRSFIQERAAFYDAVIPALSVADWERLGVSTPVNELTNLPIRQSYAEARQVGPKIDFVYLMDTILRLSSSKHRPHLYGPLLDRTFGYISTREKPFTGQSQIIGETKHERSSVKPTAVFSKEGLARFNAEAAGIAPGSQNGENEGEEVEHEEDEERGDSPRSSF